MNSEYDVGTHIDLSHMNGKRLAQTSQKKSFQEAVGNAYEVGTTFIFNKKAARRIPVVFA